MSMHDDTMELYSEFQIVVLINSNLEKFETLIKDVRTHSPSTFGKLLSYMQSLDKTNTHQKSVSYRHAIEAFVLPSWMEFRSEVKK